MYRYLTGYSAYEEIWSFSVNFPVMDANRSTNNRNRRPTVLSLRHIQGRPGQRHDIGRQATESDCGTYGKTTEMHAREER